MRRLLLMGLLLAACLSLAGCSISQEVEHQAYALVLGIERDDTGALELTIRVPTIGQSDGGTSDERQGSSSPYLVYSARGETYAQALEYLQLAVPRELNLSHVKLLIASETLAREREFKELINQIAETPHLYTTARFVVCEGSAKDFIDGQKTIIGTRLSAEIDARFDHYAAHGYIPDSSFADVYYLTNSIYSDPVAVWGFAAPVQSEDQAASALLEDPYEESDALSEAPSDEFYAGAAIFSDGVLAHRLDAQDTLLLNLALGKRDAFTFEHDGHAYALTPSGRAKKTVDIDGDSVRVGLEVKLSSIDRIEAEAIRDIENTLERALEALIRECQALRLEPFGFAEKAASRFATVQSWWQFDWRYRFAQADVSVRVRLTASGAR